MVVGENGCGVCWGEWLIGDAVRKLDVECVVLVIVADVGSDPVVSVDIGDVYSDRSGDWEGGTNGACVDDGVDETRCIWVGFFDELEKEEDVIVNKAGS